MIPWALCSKYLFLCVYYDTTSIVLRFYLDCRDYAGTTTLLLFYYDSPSLVHDNLFPGLRLHYDSTTILLRFWEYTCNYLFLQVLLLYYDSTTIVLGWYYYYTTVVLRLYYYCTIVCHSPPTMGGCLDPLCLAVVQVYVHQKELASITTSGWRMIFFLTTH